jgi:ethanolamine utilization protein EutN
MQLGRVIGTATSTVRHPTLAGWKLLVVQCLQNDGRIPDGEPLVAIDPLGAGRGDMVVISSDGRGTRALVGSDQTPIRWSVIGIQDP